MVAKVILLIIMKKEQRPCQELTLEINKDQNCEKTRYLILIKQTMVIVPRKEQVTKDGLLRVIPTENDNPEFLTDLKDIDYSVLREPKP